MSPQNKPPSNWVRKPVGIFLHIPAMYLALLYWYNAAADYLMLGGKAFLTNLPTLLLSMVLGTLGIAIWRWKPPWR